MLSSGAAPPRIGRVPKCGEDWQNMVGLYMPENVRQPYLAKALLEALRKVPWGCCREASARKLVAICPGRAWGSVQYCNDNSTRPIHKTEGYGRDVPEPVLGQRCTLPHTEMQGFAHIVEFLRSSVIATCFVMPRFAPDNDAHRAGTEPGSLWSGDLAARRFPFTLPAGIFSGTRNKASSSNWPLPGQGHVAAGSTSSSSWVFQRL